MAEVKLTVTFQPQGSDGVVVRAWVDANGDDEIADDKEEVYLATKDGKVWSGSFERERTAGVFFKVKFRAGAGTKWSFTAVSGVRTLAEVKDQVAPKGVETYVGRLG